jgi:hypothetical protein
LRWLKDDYSSAPMKEPIKKDCLAGEGGKSCLRRFQGISLLPI